jgi:excisionase family DNA binding protein
MPAATPRGLQPKAFSVKETQHRTGLGKSTVFQLLKEGQLTSVKVGNKRLVHASSVDRLLKTGAEIAAK